ncbi:hypothetical protein KQS06HV_40052 [Klebsiella quasipneumoniae subsp. similipneumoniae]|nr:hypothetical protein KQS06HV_40052 [Klebsiella quasipneumoniae subsp. similipneumoniae]SBN25787.1 hypothetical protein KVMX100_180142 [Klebsiella variicola]
MLEDDLTLNVAQQPTAQMACV